VPGANGAPGTNGTNGAKGDTGDKGDKGEPGSGSVSLAALAGTACTADGTAGLVAVTIGTGGDSVPITLTCEKIPPVLVDPTVTVSWQPGSGSSDVWLFRDQTLKANFSGSAHVFPYGDLGIMWVQSAYPFTLDCVSVPMDPIGITEDPTSPSGFTYDSMCNWGAITTDMAVTISSTP
jgi:hypothetical protein